jgi:hypothetical protein
MLMCFCKSHTHTAKQQPDFKPAVVVDDSKSESGDGSSCAVTTDDSGSGSSDGSDDDTEGLGSAGAEVLGETGSGDSHVQVKHLTTCVVMHISVQCSACVLILSVTAVYHG